MSEKKRNKLFVDPEVQGAILRRVVYYWLACFLFVTLPLWLFETMMHPHQVFYEHLGPLVVRHWPVYFTLLLLLPFVIYDALLLSNRFCGPMRRVMNELDGLNDGGDFRSLRFRDSDYWKSLADSITQLARRASEKKSAT